MIFYHTSSELNVVFEAQQMADAFWEANKEALTIFFPFQFNYPPGSKVCASAFTDTSYFCILSNENNNYL